MQQSTYCCRQQERGASRLREGIGGRPEIWAGAPQSRRVVEGAGRLEGGGTASDRVRKARRAGRSAERGRLLQPRDLVSSGVARQGSQGCHAEGNRY